MAVKTLLTPPKSEPIKEDSSFAKAMEDKKVQQFISKGGSLAAGVEVSVAGEDHRLTLRIPKWLLDKVDAKRKQRIGTISRNLWILELIDKATQK